MPFEMQKAWILLKIKLTDLVENLAELVDALAHGHRAVLAVVEHAPDGAAHPLHVHGAHLDLSPLHYLQLLKFSNLTLTKVLKTEMTTAARQQRNFKGVVTQPTILELDNMGLGNKKSLKIIFSSFILNENKNI